MTEDGIQYAPEAELQALAAKYQRPVTRFQHVPPSRPQPVQKPEFPVKILPNLTGLRTDQQLDHFIMRHRNDTAIVNYGSSWCSHCHKLFPHYIAMTREFPALRFAVAQVDYMQESIKDIQLTPTIAVYKRGRKVDQFYGSDAQRLRDHLWLHSDV